MGGLTVALVALPLALAFGISSGAGAIPGLYAAIFAGFVTSLFGGSRYQISGPTGAMTVILVDIISRHGLEGMFLAGALAGLLQIVTGLLGLGRLVKFLPYAVVSGFTNGIAVLIFLSQVSDALRDVGITAVTVIMILVALRFFRQTIPASLYGLVAGVAVNQLLFHSGNLVGDIPFSLPRVSLPLGALDSIGQLIGPAITIYLLGSIEALLSAEIADVMTGTRHDSNRELIGQGVGNIVSALVGGVPVTGAIARTAVNVKSGAKTQLSGLIHSVVLLLIVLVFGQWARLIPLAALAGILMVTAVRMADLEGLRLIPRVRWTYGATLLVTMVLTVIQDLTIAVAAGVALAILFAIADLASPRIEIRLAHDVAPNSSEPALLRSIRLITIRGPLFFVGVAKLVRHIEAHFQEQALILDLGGVSNIDETGGLMLKDLAQRFKKEGKPLYLANVDREALRTLARLGLMQELGRRHICLTRQTAVERATEDLRSQAAQRAPAAGTATPV